MSKIFLLFVAGLSLCTFSPFSIAQDVVPVIYPSISEAAKVKLTVQDLRSADGRNTRAVKAWQIFYESYQSARPELRGLRFVSDFRVAFARRNLSSSVGLSEELATVELSAEERQQAESLHREMLEAKAALDQAQKNWSDTWHQLVLDHVTATPGSGGTQITLPNGKAAVIPFPWVNGVIFTADFRVGVPH
jgi:hypothetical protein